MKPDAYDVAIVGAGPAGLSAALVLGRCRRRVLVLDSGRYRNRAARQTHGFFTRDGIAPSELRELGLIELARYPGVELRRVAVLDIGGRDERFTVQLADGVEVRCRKVLLATGLEDELPEVEGAGELFGDRMHSCPYCDGYELRDQPLAIYARGDAGGRYALTLSQWSRDLVLCTDGPPELGDATRARLDGRGIAIDDRALIRMARDGDGVRLTFAIGDDLRRRAVFFSLGCRPQSDLAARLGCARDDRGGIIVDDHEISTVPGCYVAGDASRDVLLAIVAAGEGAAAAVMINGALNAADLHPQ